MKIGHRDFHLTQPSTNCYHILIRSAPDTLSLLLPLLFLRENAIEFRLRVIRHLTNEMVWYCNKCCRKWPATFITVSGHFLQHLFTLHLYIIIILQTFHSILICCLNEKCKVIVLFDLRKIHPNQEIENVWECLLEIYSFNCCLRHYQQTSD